jgi:peroxiredoxin
MVSRQVRLFSLVPGFVLLAVFALYFAARVPVCNDAPDSRVLLAPDGTAVPVSEVAPGHPLALVTIKGPWCPVCAEQLVRLNHSLVRQPASGYIGVLTTAPPPANRKLAQELGLTIPIFGDPDGRVMTELGFLRDKRTEPIPGVIFFDGCGNAVVRHLGRRPGQDQTGWIHEVLDTISRSQAARCAAD